MMTIRSKNRKNGFTMIELMIVVVIVGVLAAIAVPIYGNYIKNSRVTEATSRIGEIITSAKAWAQENQDANGDPIWPSGEGGIVDLAASENFTYAIQGGGNATTSPLVVTATGQAKMAGVTVVVNVPDIFSNGDPPQITGM